MKNEYLTYNVAEFVVDEGFINWVKAGKGDAQWKNWLDKHPEISGVVAEARSIVGSIKFRSYKMDENLKVDLWNKIDQATNSDSRETKSRRIFMISSIAAAAAVVLILYSIFSNPSGTINITTEIGKQEMVSLPDNSTIKLNAMSSVQYDRDAFNTERVLNLEGEGFFQVEKGSTFTVLTDHGSVQVLGTSFNVYARGDSISVACFTGMVKVSNGTSEVILTAGESVSYNNIETDIAKNTFEKEEENPSWIRGMFTFENQKLSTVFEELSRQFDVEIKYEDEKIAEIMVGVSFFETGSLDKALDEITYPYLLTYTKEGKKVVIKKQ